MPGNDRKSSVRRWLKTTNPKKATELVMYVQEENNTEPMALARWERQEVSKDPDKITTLIDELGTDQANDLGQAVRAVVQWEDENGQKLIDRGMRFLAEDANKLDGTLTNQASQAQRHAEMNLQALITVTGAQQQAFQEVSRAYREAMETVTSGWKEAMDQLSQHNERLASQLMNSEEGRQQAVDDAEEMAGQVLELNADLERKEAANGGESEIDKLVKTLTPQLLPHLMQAMQGGGGNGTGTGTN